MLNRSAEAGSFLIIIPAWNEEASLPAVITNVKEAVPDADVLVVNDGSIDSTSDVARSTGVLVLDLPFNLGVGGAMRTGFHYAVRHRYSFAAQVDADGQHNPKDLIPMLRAARAGNDIVIGARFAGVGSYTAHGPRKWAMSLLAFVMSRFARTTLTDVTSGFKVYSQNALEFFCDHYPAEYLGDTIEALMLAIKSGLKVTQVPVEMYHRTAGVPSHSPLKAALYLIRATLSLIVAIISPVPRRTHQCSATD